MSRNKRHSPEKPQAWLDRAKGNLAHARAAAGGKGVFWEDVCMELTEYAVATRYPGDDEPCTEADFEQALRCAQAVVRWAGKIIRKGVGK